MLEELQIKDFALIDTVFIEFKSGFTVLSGETGAGKSILIGALSFLLGGKGGVEQIRAGCHEAKVTGTISITDNKEAVEWLSEHGIDIEDNRVLLRRLIKENGKSSSWIQDTPVTRNELAEFTAFLVDIHGQHEHQTLLYPAFHRKYLDSFASITTEVEQFTEIYTQLVEKRKELSQLNTSEDEINRKKELINFAIEEIEALKLKNNEDIELATEENKLLQYEKLYKEIDEAINILNSDDGGIVTLVKKISQHISYAADFDKELSSLSQRAESAFYEYSDISEELKGYKESLFFDPERLEEIQERSAQIFKLKKKYASSVQAPLSEVINYAIESKKQLELLENNDKQKSEIKNAVTCLERKVYEKARSLSEKRKQSAIKMSEDVIGVLAVLGMKNTQFSVSVNIKKGDSEEQRCGPYGFDDVEFLISANPGSPLKSLDKIASGGELSRVMLALKTILAASDTVDTLIFDEIDTGIGGEIAVVVGKHMKKLAKKQQILCITHLASIAVYADTQIKIEKSVQDGKTSTHINEITGNERVSEIARMLSGDSVSEASLQHAKILLDTYNSIRE